VIELDAPTAGQAVTAHLAGDALHDKAAPMMIYNIDTFVHPDSIQPRDIRGDGWIPCFNAPGEAWSFAAADETGRVHDIREKNRISNHATIGLYWFSSFDLYSAHYQKYYSNDANIEAGERYVAPIYNGLIADGHPVYITDVPFKSVIPLGVPDDLNRFLARMPPEV
jgi:hypothetical protein